MGLEGWKGRGELIRGLKGKDSKAKGSEGEDRKCRRGGWGYWKGRTATTAVSGAHREDQTGRLEWEDGKAGGWLEGLATCSYSLRDTLKHGQGELRTFFKLAHLFWPC